MVRLVQLLLAAASVSACAQNDPEKELREKLLEEAHAAVAEDLGDPEEPQFSDLISFTFPRQGLVCGRVRASSDAPEKVYAYSRADGAVVGDSLLYGEMYGRCLIALKERDQEIQAEAKAGVVEQPAS